MTPKDDLKEQYEFLQQMLNNIGDQLDKVAERQLARAVAAYPKVAKDPELGKQHAELVKKGEEVLAKMNAIQGQIVELSG